MRIYRGSDADIVLRPFMVRLSEIVSFDLQLWTSGAYVIKRSTTESGMTTDKENNLINVHLTDKETSYLDAGVLNAKMMYRITDSEYPDGTYDGIITIPQEYYMMTPPDYSGGTAGDIYESGYTEGYNTAIQNSVLSINGEKGDLNLKTINGNGLLGEGDIKIEGGGSVTSVNGKKGDVVIDIPKKTSQLQNDSKYINQSSQSSIYNIEHMWVGNQSQYDALETKDARTLFIII